MDCVCTGNPLYYCNPLYTIGGVCLYVKTPVVPFVENPFRHVFENAFIKTPLLYAVALSLWRGIVSLFCNDLRFCPRFILQEHFCDPYRAVYVFHFRKLRSGDSPLGETAAGRSF